ncbi:MAG: RNA ligase family protein [Rhodothermales bacterium]
MDLDLRAVDLDLLNSLTKYPSIATYHALDPSNGRLLDQPASFFGPVLLTEKIDGTNVRIVCIPGGDYLLGSRSEFLLAKGDLIGNPALGIVEALRDVAENVAAQQSSGTFRVYFGEFYGHKVTQAAKEYTGEGRVGFRLFDIAEIPDFAERMRENRAAISEWRESGGQTFLSESALQIEASRLNLQLTPRLGEVDSLPAGLEETIAFLEKRIPVSLSALDSSARNQAEGIVARSLDRSQIAKIRYADYRRTLRGRK